MSPAAKAVLAATSNVLEMELACGDVKLVRRRLEGVEIFVRSTNTGKYPRTPALALDEIEAADLNNKLDELLRQ